MPYADVNVYRDRLVFLRCIDVPTSFYSPFFHNINTKTDDPLFLPGVCINAKIRHCKFHPILVCRIGCLSRQRHQCSFSGSILDFWHTDIRQNKILAAQVLISAIQIGRDPIQQVLRYNKNGHLDHNKHKELDNKYQYIHFSVPYLTSVNCIATPQNANRAPRTLRPNLTVWAPGPVCVIELL